VITYQVEPWAMYRGDCQAIWAEHYDEIAGDKARMPMRPHEALYERLEATGALQVMTARSAGRLVGYMLFNIQPHPHYADILCGFEDAYFLSATHRNGMAGVRLIRQSIAALKARGVKRVFIHTKKAKDVGRILTFLGLTHSDEIYSAWIGD
jgi:L-amino acid N-acyltransferase YncA